MHLAVDIAQFEPTDTEHPTKIVNHITYDSFGNIVHEENPTYPAEVTQIVRDEFDNIIEEITVPNPDAQPPAKHLFGYTARPFDEATYLQNNLNRWYDAVIGQWLSEDPIGFEAGDANLRRYVENDPLIATDPTGNSKFSGGAKAIRAWARKIIAQAAKNNPNRANALSRLLSESVAESTARKLSQRGVWKTMRLALERMGWAKYFHVHHILQKSLFFVDPKTMKTLSARGKFLQSIEIYPHAPRNLMFLPNKLGKNWAGRKTVKVVDSKIAEGYRKIVNRALHDGNHVSDYMKGVEKVIDEIRRDVGKKILTKANAADQVRALQAELREGLRTGKYVLSKEELDLLRKPMNIVRPTAISIGSLVIVALNPIDDPVARASTRMLETHEKLEPLKEEAAKYTGSYVAEYVQASLDKRLPRLISNHFLVRSRISGTGMLADFVAPVNGDDALMALQYMEFRAHLNIIHEEMLGARHGMLGTLVNGVYLDQNGPQAMTDLYVIAVGLTAGVDEDE